MRFKRRNSNTLKSSFYTDARNKKLSSQKLLLKGICFRVKDLNLHVTRQKFWRSENDHQCFSTSYGNIKSLSRLSEYYHLKT